MVLSRYAVLFRRTLNPITACAIVTRMIPSFPYSYSRRWASGISSPPPLHTIRHYEEKTIASEDRRVVELSQFVMNNDVKSSLRAYSELPLFLPRSDFRTVCSLMQQLGQRCGIPDMSNVFLKIMKMKLTRKHALTFRCLIHVSCELRDAELIERFYASICEEEVYVNNSFLNDVVVDSLTSLDAFSSLCHIFDSMQTLLDNGQILPTFNNHSSQNALSAFITEGRDDLVLFFLHHIKQNWRIPVVFTDYIISNASKYRPYTQLFDRCIESQPKSATIHNAIIQFYAEDGSVSNALKSIEKALLLEVKVTAVSFKDVCDLLLVCNQDHIAVEHEEVRQFCERISSLDRGGYIVMLGLTPLEMMLAYKEIDYAIHYIDLLKLYENGLTRRDIVLLEDIKKEVTSETTLCKSLDSLIMLLRKKYYG